MGRCSVNHVSECTVIFLSPLFSYFFNRQIVAEVILKKKKIEMIDAESLKQMERITWMLWVHRNLLKTASLLSHSTVELA